MDKNNQNIEEPIAIEEAKELVDVLSNGAARAGYKIQWADDSSFIMRKAGAQVEDPSFRVQITDLY